MDGLEETYRRLKSELHNARMEVYTGFGNTEPTTAIDHAQHVHLTACSEEFILKQLAMLHWEINLLKSKFLEIKRDEAQER